MNEMKKEDVECVLFVSVLVYECTCVLVSDCGCLFSFKLF